MKKEIYRIISSKLLIVWIIISSLIVLLSFKNYNSKKEIEHKSYYFLIQSDNRDEIIKERDSKVAERESLKKEEKNYEAEYLYLTETIEIYNEVIDGSCKIEEIYENGQMFIENDGLVFLLYSKRVIIVLSLVSLLFFICLTMTNDFDYGIYNCIYHSKRYKIVIKKMTAILIVFLGYFTFVVALMYILSLLFENDYNYVVLVANRKIKIINRGFFLVYYWLFNMLFIIAFFFLIISSIFVYTRSTLKFLGFSIIIVCISAYVLFFLNVGEWIGVVNYVSHLNPPLLYFSFYPFFLIIPGLLFAFSLRHYEKIDL